MTNLRWEYEPDLHHPIVLTAFGGWNDAGDAATTALRFIADEWGADRAGEIDPDNFYDFTQSRPTVSIDSSGQRVIQWPTPEVFAASEPPALLVIANEPQHRWRAFCEEIIDVAQAFEASHVIHLGALLAEVPHSRPVPVTTSGVAGIDDVGRSTKYQGPTGIVGVLHQACESAGLATTSLWAAVPTYVSGASSPKAALALVQRVAEVIQYPIGTGLLEISADAYEGEISKLLHDDADTSAYIERLEHEFDDDCAQNNDHIIGTDAGSPLADADADVDRLAAEIEKFLRDHPR